MRRLETQTSGPRNSLVIGDIRLLPPVRFLTNAFRESDARCIDSPIVIPPKSATSCAAKRFRQSFRVIQLRPTAHNSLRPSAVQ